MAIRRIITAPDPILKTRCVEISTVGSDVLELLEDLRDSMAASEIPGIGLASIQIGIPRRALIADVANNEYGGGIVEMINPSITFAEGSQVFEEGCLSVPEYWAEVSRPSNIVVQYIDKFGNKNELALTDMCATVVQHEIDHLDGKLFIDHLSRPRREIAIRKLKKIKKREGSNIAV